MEETRTCSGFPLDLNSASQEDLQALGLSAELAAAVLAYGADHGPWTGLDQLLQVPGMDASTLDALTPHLTILPECGEPSIESEGRVAGLEEATGEPLSLGMEEQELLQGEAGPGNLEQPVAPPGPIPEPCMAPVEGSSELSEPEALPSSPSPEPATPAEHAAEESAPPPNSAEAARVSDTERERSSIWRGVGLFVLGGVLGALVTLAVLHLLGGSPNYASRRLVDALSENVATMQRNQEVTWQETQALVERVDGIEQRLAGTEDRIATLERDSDEAAGQLAAARTSLESLDARLASLEERYDEKVPDLEERILSLDDRAVSLEETVSSVAQSTNAIQDQITRYEAFFTALRELLANIESGDGAESGGM